MSNDIEQQSALDERSVRDRFVIVDGHALIYRAYHAFPGLTDTNGMLVNAVYGFARILLTAIRDQEPQYIALAFDSKEKTNRAKEYAEYKAHRPEMPDDLKPQIAICKKVVEALNIPQFEKPGFEADDLIGTISKRVCAEDTSGQCPLTVIVTGDKDLFQLVDKDVLVWLPGRGKRSVDTEYDADGVQAKMGLRPDQIVDMKALMGDPSDNIPGVKGIGEKTAVKLLTEYQTLEKLYERIDYLEQHPKEKDELVKGAVFTKLVRDKEQAFMSQSLATVLRDVEIDFHIEKCTVSDYDKTVVVNLFEELGFKSLLGLLPKDSFEAGVQSALF